MGDPQQETFGEVSKIRDFEAWTEDALARLVASYQHEARLFRDHNDKAKHYRERMEWCADRIRSLGGEVPEADE